MTSAIETLPAAVAAALRRRFGMRLGTPAIVAAVLLSLIVLMAVFAPFIATANPTDLDPGTRLQGLSAAHLLGTDAFGRDVFSRTVYGARISLVVGLGATVASMAIGLLIGVMAGYFRWFDAVVMRVMDGLMAIPSILLAIALVALSGSSLTTVLVAITIPEIPRVVRLVRSVILGVRNEAYVEAAVSLGTPTVRLMLRHLVPNTVAPMIVQGTYIFAAAIITEAMLSFLGAGVPPETASWGNIMAESRSYFQLIPGLLLYPGVLLSVTVLAVNVLGDAMRDALDPRLARRL